MKKALFLDRDDTIIRDPGYLSRVEQIEFFPGVLPRIAALRKKGFAVFIVTNQSGIGRGYFSEERLEEIHTALLDQMARQGALVDAINYCPLLPEDASNRRKPKPTMIFELAKEFDIDLPQSYFVGDKAVDIIAGQSAGCKTVLIAHKRNITEIPGLESCPLPDYIALTPEEALLYVLNDSDSKGENHNE